MATSFIAKLSHGKDFINLQSAPFGLKDTFSPPSYSSTLVVSGATSANRGGANRVSDKPQNRSFSFDLMVGSATSYTTAQLHAAVSRIQSMLDYAGDETYPVYFEWKPNSDTPEPVVGVLGCNLRYEIVQGRINLPPTYGMKAARDKTLICSVDLVIKPYAENRPQPAARASGGVLYDTLGSVDGNSRALYIPEATTNVFTNPVFGAATYSTSWTVGSSVVLTQNTDKNYCWPGQINSAYVYSKSATNNLFTQSVTLSASTSFITIYVKKYDGTAVTTTDCNITYNAITQTTTFTSWGNGVYQLRASVTGTGGAAGAGIIIGIGRGVVVLGAQAEVKAYYTPLAYGDMLGCAWTGTAHASTSTRTVSTVSYAITDALTDPAIPFNYQSGCIRVCVEYPLASTVASASTPGGGVPVFFTSNTGTWVGYINKANNTVIFDDSTSAATSSAITWSERQRDIFHFVWSPQTKTIYRNGSQLVTSAAYTIPTAGARIYIDGQAANPSGFGLADFALWDQSITAQQVADDYATLYPLLITDAQKGGSVPYVWTKDGDGIIDNADDSNNSTNNWGVVQGVPGTMQSGYRVEFNKSTTTYTVWLGRMATRNFVYPRSVLFHDCSGTADVGASSGDSYTNTAALSTTETTVGAVGAYVSPAGYFALLAGRTFIPFIRAYDATTSNAMYYRFRFSPNNSISSNYLYSDYKTITSPASSIWDNYAGQPFTFASEADVVGAKQGPITFGTSLSFTAMMYRVTGSAAFRCDYIFLMPEQTLQVEISENTRTILVDDKGRTPGYENTSRDYIGPVFYTKVVNGWRDGFEPESYNWLCSQQGRTTAPSSSLITHSLTFYRITLTPRYALL